MITKRALTIVALTLAAVFGLVGPAAAEISVGQAFGVWKPYIDAAISAAAFAAVGFVVFYVNKMTGLKIEDSQREALQTALTNAAGLVVNQLGNKLDGKVITSGHQAIDQAVNYVLKSAPQAVERFALSPAELREKIIAKVPQVAPAVTPIVTVPTRSA
jgi:hypothetical protein